MDPNAVILLLAGCVQALSLYLISDIKDSLRDLWSVLNKHKDDKEIHR